MSVQATFFKESHTSLGVFYPMHYVIAVFDTLAAAHRVAVEQLAGGLNTD
jgi:hypothetical protein